MAERYTTQPIHMDEYGGRHYPPQRHPQAPPPPSTSRPRRPRYDGADKEARRPRRAHTYRAPPPPSSTTSPSPPARRPPPRRSPRNHDRSLPEEDYYAPRRRRHREEDYFSDDRHDRRAPPPRDRHHERDAPKQSHVQEEQRVRDRPERERPGRPERKGSKWQKEGKKLFNEYAVPAIKAEGTKYISKQIGNMLAKGVS